MKINDDLAEHRPEHLWTKSQLRRRVRVGARDMVREGSADLIRSHWALLASGKNHKYLQNLQNLNLGVSNG